LAVKVTGWQTDGLAGDTVTLATAGAAGSTTMLFVTGALSPEAFWEVSVTDFEPAEPNDTGTLEAEPPEAFAGLPSWKVQVQLVGDP
jgi:hypothetical protein